jgi:hypothetical protein
VEKLKGYQAWLTWALEKDAPKLELNREDLAWFKEVLDAEIAWQSVIDEGRFPDEAEREYRKNFEAKCKKTGVNVLSDAYDDGFEAGLEFYEQKQREFDQKITDEAVREAIAVLDETVPIDESDADYRGAVKTIKQALRQMPTEPCEICGNFNRILCMAGTLEFMAVRCPNCGRKLNVGKSEGE